MKPLPLLESVAAVLLIGTVATLTALPAQRGDGSEDQAASAELSDSLGLLRTAIFRFSMEHEAADGGALLPGRCGADLVAQLTGASRRDGGTDPQESVTGRDDRWYGPYLDAIPVNPANGLSTIRLMPEGYDEPVVNGSAGWVYVCDTGRIHPDLPGADARGVEYSTF
jgi:hypothetical protein